MRSRPGTLHRTRRNMQGSKLSRLPYVFGIFSDVNVTTYFYSFVTVNNLKPLKVNMLL